MGQDPYFPRETFRPWGDNWLTTTVLNGASSLFPKRNSSSMRRQLIDYYGTRWGKLPISQEELFVHEATVDWLLRCSISGWDMFPIFSSSMRWRLIRLLRYSTFGGTCFLYLKRTSSRSWDDNLIDYYGIRYLDGTCSLSPKRIPGWDMLPYLPNKIFSHPWDDELLDY
jgi:hypothetical protein